MSVGRSKEEQELTAHLAKTLVAREVLEPMSKIGWGHGTPPPPESGQPAPEGAPGKEAAPAAAPGSGQPATAAASAPASTPGAKADTPSIENLVALFESLRDPATGLIAKKYKTVEEAVKGNVHLATMAKQSFDERDELRKKLEEIASRGTFSATATAPAVVPQARPADPPSRAVLDQAQAKLDAVLSSITENGGVLDAENSKALSRAQREVAEAAANLKVQENLDERQNRSNQENAEWTAVDEYMKSNHPEAERFTQETALFIQSDPLLAGAINAYLSQNKKREATEFAWLAYEKHRQMNMTASERKEAEDKEVELGAREQVRKEKLEAARKDAGVISGSAGGTGVHENKNAGLATAAEIAAAREAMLREGQAPGTPAAMRFRNLVIGPSLDPAIFGPR